MVDSPAFFSRETTRPVLIAERQQFWDECQPWTECLARFYDALHEELSFKPQRLGPEARRAEAEMAGLSKLQRLVLKHLIPSSSKQGRTSPGNDVSIALACAIDSSGIKLEEELRGNARETLTVLRRKGVVIDTWDSRIHQQELSSWTKRHAR